MKKFIGILVLLIVVGAAGGAAYLYLNKNQLVKAAIEKFGPEMTKTKVTVESADLNISDERVTVNKMHVGNPEGYKTDHFFEANQMSIKLEVASLNADPMVINQIKIENPSLVYENAGTKSNAQAILDNVNAFLGDEEGAGMVIEHVLVTGIKANVSHKALMGKKLTIDIPDVELKECRRRMTSPSLRKRIRRRAYLRARRLAKSWKR